VALLKQWENGQVQPASLLLAAHRAGGSRRVASIANTKSRSLRVAEGSVSYTLDGVDEEPLFADFLAKPEVVRTVVECERLAYGHLCNLTFATEISVIDPLPHQCIAVYDHMLKQTRLRFLLTDDAGAGKTIMAGLYIREMLSRRLISCVLIVPPAGLVGNWEHELRTLFNLPFRMITGGDIKNGNPFTTAHSDLSLLKKSFAELYSTAKRARCPQRVCLFTPFSSRKMSCMSLKTHRFSFSTGWISSLSV
jgi:SNF2 family DNA or RNA helicase